MASDGEEGAQGFGDLFQDPEGFFQPDKPPTFAEHQMRSGQTLKLRLVGDHPLYVRTANDCLSDF
jgi:nicotinamide N-methyltransferase